MLPQAYLQLHSYLCKLLEQGAGLRVGSCTPEVGFAVAEAVTALLEDPVPQAGAVQQLPVLLSDAAVLSAHAGHFLLCMGAQLQ